MKLSQSSGLDTACNSLKVLCHHPSHDRYRYERYHLSTITASLLTNQSDSPYAKLEARINGMELVQVDDIEAAITYPVPKYLMMEDGDYLAMVEPTRQGGDGGRISAFTVRSRFSWRCFEGHR